VDIAGPRCAHRLTCPSNIHALLRPPSHQAPLPGLSTVQVNPRSAMVRIAVSVAFVASIALSALASPTEHGQIKTIPVKKIRASSGKAILANDFGRLQQAASGRQALSKSSESARNEVDSYIAAVKFGNQTFNLIVDTGAAHQLCSRYWDIVC
jgi:hypothetical protein